MILLVLGCNTFIFISWEKIQALSFRYFCVCEESLSIVGRNGFEWCGKERRKSSVAFSCLFSLYNNGISVASNLVWLDKQRSSSPGRTFVGPDLCADMTLARGEARTKSARVMVLTQAQSREVLCPTAHMRFQSSLSGASFTGGEMSHGMFVKIN